MLCLCTEKAVVVGSQGQRMHPATAELSMVTSGVPLVFVKADLGLRCG